MKRGRNTAWGRLFKGCLSLIVIVTVVVFGIRYTVRRYGEGDGKGGAGRFDADWRGYEDLLVRRLDIEMNEDRRLYLIGSVINTGPRNLRNARLRITVSADMRGGQKREKTVNLGQILSGQEREYNKYLYGMPGDARRLHPGLYKVELVDIWFKREESS